MISRGSHGLIVFLLLAAILARPASADTYPSLSQVYEAVQAGRLAQAQKMIREVLRDHPKSAMAHYVAAEVNAASGNFDRGREELRLAREIAPGLPFAASESVQELQDKLSRAPSAQMAPARESKPQFPWGVAAVAVIGMGVILAAMIGFGRRALKPPR